MFCIIGLPVNRAVSVIVGGRKVGQLPTPEQNVNSQQQFKGVFHLQNAAQTEVKADLIALLADARH